MSKIDNVKIGTLRKVLSAFDGKTHGYEIHKKTGISLAEIYTVMKIMTDADFMQRAGMDPKWRRKYRILTEKGERLRKILEE